MEDQSHLYSSFFFVKRGTENGRPVHVPMASDKCTYGVAKRPHWFIQGSLSAGGQRNQKKVSSYFPLAPDGCENPGTASAAGNFLTSIEAGHSLTPEFMVGAKREYAVIADNDEAFASGHLRCSVKTRAGSFRADLGFSDW